MERNKIVEPTIFTSNKLFIKELLSYKYFYILLTSFLLISAFIYNKISTAEYQVYAAMIATKNEASSVLQGSNNLFRGMESFQTYNNIEDGINKLRSFSMISSTLDALNFEVGYYSERKGLLKTKNELYQYTPFFVTIHKSHLQPLETKFYISILNDSTFKIHADNGDAYLFNYIDNEVAYENYPVRLDKVYKFNKEIELNYMSLTVSKNMDFKETDQGKYNYYFVLYNPDLMAKSILKDFNVYRASPSSSIINISYKGRNLEKSIFFINSYLNHYIDESLTQKNAIARNTINFIDSQISGISDSLTRSESEISSYRSANQVMNLSYQAQTAYNNLQGIDQQRNDLLAQERYYSYILEYLKTTQDVAGITPPSGMRVDNPVMTQLITQLMDLNAQRSNIISLRGEKNPFLAEIENKMKSQRQYITEIASSNLNTVKQTISDLDYKSTRLAKEISSMPRQEINMGNIQRKYNIDEAIYTFFLQKRSEATVTMASNLPDFTIFEPARVATSYKVAPHITRNFLIALILGFLIPTCTMILKNLLNFKISNPEFIHQIIGRPAVASIFNFPEKAENVIYENPATICAESIRTLRSILFRKLSGSTGPKVVLITSAQPQDGKSFVSLNLATSIAMVGKKSLIIDADMKRPVLHEKFNLKNGKGISNYITGASTFEEIIHKTDIDNLSFISAGPMIPNSTEVIESGGMDPLMKSTKEKFDFVILDTSPIGFMTDALVMTRYADYILIVVRNNSTLKESFTDVINNLESNKITNYDVILNDKDSKDNSHGYYNKYYIKDKKTII